MQTPDGGLSLLTLVTQMPAEASWYDLSKLAPPAVGAFIGALAAVGIAIGTQLAIGRRELRRRREERTEEAVEAFSEALFEMVEPLDRGERGVGSSAFLRMQILRGVASRCGFRTFAWQILWPMWLELSDALDSEQHGQIGLKLGQIQGVLAQWLEDPYLFDRRKAPLRFEDVRLSDSMLAEFDEDMERRATARAAQRATEAGERAERAE